MTKSPTDAPRGVTARPAPVRQHRARSSRGYALRVFALVATIAALWLASLAYGETTYTLGEVFSVFTADPAAGAGFTVGELRLPRATTAVAAGLAFGAAGVVFQTLLRNQLASPDIIGISAGASAAGVSAIVFLHASQAFTSAFSLVASLLLAGAIYLLSVRSGFNGSRLILMGIAMAALLQAWTNYVLSKAAAWDVPTATRWLTGSLNTMSFERAAPLLLTVAIAVPALVAATHQLGLLSLGEDLATGLGTRTRVVRIGCIAGAVALIATATATTGPIAFVAFMSGPIAARLFRPGAPLVLPGALVGALIVLGADLAGQYLFGTRYPVGVITGLIGAPFLVFLLTRTHR